MITIHWAIRTDLPQMLLIEAESFDSPWGENDFILCLRRRNHIAMVAKDGDRVVGYMVYVLHKYCLDVLNFAVASDYRRRGVGRMMVEKLMSKLTPDRRNRVMFTVADFNLEGHLFLKAMGFRAVCVARQPYEDSDADAYVFQRRYEDWYHQTTEFTTKTIR